MHIIFSHLDNIILDNHILIQCTILKLFSNDPPGYQDMLLKLRRMASLNTTYEKKISFNI